MPIYEFMCKKCGYVFEQFYKTYKQYSTTIIQCPKCNSFNIQRRFSVPKMIRISNQSVTPARKRTKEILRHHVVKKAEATGRPLPGRKGGNR